MPRQKRTLVRDGGQSEVQGFSPTPELSGEYIIGTSPPVNVDGHLAIRWSSKNDERVRRRLNGNSVGLTATEGLDVLNGAIETVVFDGVSGHVIEYEIM